jgi:hypothetical protein
MKTFFTRFFVIMGVIFFMLLCAGAYLWFADPFGIQPLVRMVMTPKGETQAAPAGVQNNLVDKNPALSLTQEKALETIGVDPAALPTTITKTQKACFVQVLGSARVAEIEAGSTPTASEFFSARSCLTK